jgi:soluble lytic murein transglycosylase
MTYMRMSEERFGRNAVVVVLLLWLGVCASPTVAGTQTLEQERQLFLQAEEALSKGQRSEFARLSAQLVDYPLYPYLIYGDLRKRLGTAKPGDIQAFLYSYADLPIARSLRSKWLDLLWSRRDWAGFLAAWDPLQSTRLQCRHLRALLAVGETEVALSQVEPLWLSGRSQPKACDPLFDAWRAAGYQTRDLVWQRIDLAMAARQTRLAQYLRRFLPAEERAWVDTWLAVHSNPARLRTEKNLSSHPIGAKIFLHGIRRQARSEPSDAAREWMRLRDDYSLSQDQIAMVGGDIGVSFALKHKPQAVTWLNAVDDEYSTSTVRRWRVLGAVRFEDWQAVLGAIERLLPDEQADPQWQYWKARGQEALGQVSEATAIYKRLAQQRNYYGFLAADRNGSQYHFNEQRLGFSTPELDATVNRHPGIVRARELYMLGRRFDARREWYGAVQKMDEQDKARVAQYAHDLGWHGRAIITVASTPYLDDLELRFPLAYKEYITKQASTAALDPAWVFAVVRQESAFMPDARSPVGALGLMQIMPQTGKTIARSLNTPKPSSTQLLEPSTSIRFGSHYLRTLLDRFGGHPALATAAYNAGPHRVERWVPSSMVMPGDIWIETVPFGETREYVRRVFAYMIIYERRLGERKQRLSDRLLPVPPSRDIPVAQTDS